MICPHISHHATQLRGKGIVTDRPKTAYSNGRIPFKEDDDLTRVHVLNFLDGQAYFWCARECDGGLFPAMNVSWYPSIDTSIIL